MHSINCNYVKIVTKPSKKLQKYRIMIFNSTEREYIKPSLAVVDVTCEAGFQNSTGDLSFVDGVDDGWYGL